MILVRQVFQVPVGKAREVAGMIMKSVAQYSQAAGPQAHGRVLTDITGPFGTVVLEIEVESLTEWERLQTATSAESEGQQGSSGSAPPFTGGYQDFYTIEGSF